MIFSYRPFEIADCTGKGRGRQVIAVARTADLVLMMLDATKGEIQKLANLYIEQKALPIIINYFNTLDIMFCLLYCKLNGILSVK